MAVTIACNNDSDKIKTFSALADITGSPSLTAAKEKYNMTVMFSSDGGQTFTDWPAVAKGQTYLAKVVASDNAPIQPGSCYAVDWSGSTPEPNTVTGTTAEFTMGHDNALLAKITDTDYGPFDRSFWLGDFRGDESGDGNSHDDLTFKADPSNPNAVIMSNFFGDGDAVTIQVVFTPSTSANNQVLTIPAQTTSEGGSVAATTGTYDQCSQTIKIASIKYTIGGGTADFGYSIHR